MSKSMNDWDVCLPKSLTIRRIVVSVGLSHIVPWLQAEPTISSFYVSVGRITCVGCWIYRGKCNNHGTSQGSVWRAMVEWSSVIQKLWTPWSICCGALEFQTYSCGSYSHQCIVSDQGEQPEESASKLLQVLGRAISPVLRVVMPILDECINA